MRKAPGPSEKRTDRGRCRKDARECSLGKTHVLPARRSRFLIDPPSLMSLPQLPAQPAQVHARQEFPAAPIKSARGAVDLRCSGKLAGLDGAGGNRRRSFVAGAIAASRPARYAMADAKGGDQESVASTDRGLFLRSGDPNGAARTDGPSDDANYRRAMHAAAIETEPAKRPCRPLQRKQGTFAHSLWSAHFLEAFT